MKNGFHVATIGACFSLPFYIMLLCKPPASIVAGFSIWVILLVYFYLIKDD